MIRSIIPVSLLDWPGHMSSVIYLGGCNWICEYCHNHDLVNLDSIPYDDVIESLRKVRDLVDHVVISGGEPTLWRDYLETLVDALIEDGYSVGIHTNGSNPGILYRLIPKLGFVGMDIKGGRQVYSEWIHGASVVEIEKSVRLLQLSGIDHEFRSTMYPLYVNDQLISDFFDLMREWHIKEITLQQYLDNRGSGIIPVKYSELKVLVDKYSKNISVFYRGFDKFISE